MRASQRLSGHTGQQSVDVFGLIGVDVDQFYGIEIEEFPAQIAQVRLLTTRRTAVSEEFGPHFAAFHSPPARCGCNAPRPIGPSCCRERCSMAGNPPLHAREPLGARWGLIW
ncbi:MAG: hypothetical protein IPN53_09655 [Comamonadaceae bacterium]|nr:hypothetical protein [Comamonadaceae bacterium]